MKNYAILLAATLSAAVGAVAATYLGYPVLGFALLVLALTPLPAAMAYRVRDAGPMVVQGRRGRVSAKWSRLDGAPRPD
jgi:hypothetical protein